jgi:hypothetical protein
MHKCVNNTIGNVYHLEQWVDNFFPYSQKQLRFDQPVSIVFQSDEENASRMLGKTAYYDPESMQVVLYTDNRHPKDVMRSLSHELVHHAQNCRGDFKAETGMETGYAQNDPHLRKMEREAYTKGNLIFRDFEDLIKTGKINIEIDFSDSGEPKMSLKEWKNNEINAKLMKKWGFGLLKESVNPPEGEEEEAPPEEDPDAGDMDGHKKPVEESCGPDEDELEEGYPGGIRGFGDDVRDAVGMKRKHTDRDGSARPGGDDAGDWARIADAPEDVTAVPNFPIAFMSKDKRGVRGGRPVPRAAGSDVSAKDRRAGSTNPLGSQPWRENKKISVREAKEMTRRIIERIKKESK